MQGTTVRIQNESRKHAEALGRALGAYTTELVQRDGSWQLEVDLGELGPLLLLLFNEVGDWQEENHVASLLLHFDERTYTLLRPDGPSPDGSSRFLLERVAQLETALGSRVVIEQAKGIVACTLGIDVASAFDTMRRRARGERMSLRELAAAIVDDPTQAKTVLGG